MASSPQKPFQFGLGSIFVATAVIAVAFGLLKCVGPFGLLAVMLPTVPLVVVIAMLVKSRRRVALVWFLIVMVVEVIGLYYLLSYLTWPRE